MPVIRVTFVDADGRELYHHDLTTVDYAMRFARAQLDEGQAAGARLMTGRLDTEQWGRTTFTPYDDGLRLLLSLDDRGHLLEMVG